MDKIDFFARELDKAKLCDEFMKLSREEANEVKADLIKHRFYGEATKDGVVDYISYAVAGAAGVSGGVAVASVVGASSIPIVTSALGIFGIGASIACPPLALAAGAVVGAGALVGATHLIKNNSKSKGEQKKIEEQRTKGDGQVVFNTLNPLIFARIEEFQEAMGDKREESSEKIAEILFQAYPLTNDEKMSVDLRRLEGYIGTGWSEKILSDSKKKSEIADLLAQSDKKLKQIKQL